MKCYDCPRACGADRDGGQTGYCRCGAKAVVNKFIERFEYEEPCLGEVAAVFFGGCNLGCSYCQNAAISKTPVGTEYDDRGLAALFDKAYSLDLVTPTPWLSAIERAIPLCKKPHRVVYNTSGYETVEAVRRASMFTQVFLTDFKYADDGAAEIVKEFKSGKLTLGVDDLGAEAASVLTGSTIDSNHVVISASEDGGSPVAIGFRAEKANGCYRYFWLYRVKFGVPATNLATKGDGITFSTPTIEGTILHRNKLDASGKHPWKAEVTEGDKDVTAATITGWYDEGYEPSYAAEEV